MISSREVAFQSSIKSETVRFRRKRFVQRILLNWQLYLFVLPAVAYFIIFQYIPMYGVQIAFRDYKTSLGFWGSKWVGFKHFIRFFNSYYFVTIIRNTLTITTLSLIVGFPVPIILALLLNEIMHEKYKKLVQTVTFAPHFISTVVICGMLVIFLNPTSGIINHILAFLGHERINFLQQSHYFKWIYVLSGVWQEAGWNSVIYFAALSAVDNELLEAARIDGANKVQRIIYINLPVLIPTIIILLIMRSGSLLSVGYEKVYLLQNDTNLSASEVISTYVYKRGLIDSDYSFSSAVGLFNSCINCIMLVVVNYIAKKVSETSLW
ncbi:MAG: sugar ABC transporter permease [Clostridiaceae bacterium]|nr:sugar ABC transporter permease [Clostridiaceae bacterium]